EEFAKPLGNWLVAEVSNSRGVPIPFAARIVTSAVWKCSFPVRSTYVAPVTRPRPFVSSRRTRAPVIRCTPSITFPGQCVRSTDPLAPSTQPHMHVARCVQGRRFLYGRVAMAFGAGHQCQPNRL